MNGTADYPRSTAPPQPRPALPPLRAPRWLANLLIALGAQDARRDTYEVTFARSGRVIEVVTVRASSEEAAIGQAQRYLFANIYPLRTEKTGEPSA